MQSCQDCKQEFDRAEFADRGHVRTRCRPCRKLKQRSQDRKPVNRLSQLKAVCKKKGWKITLNIEEYEKLLAQPCFYCEGPLSPFGRGIDKWNPLKGYTPDNVVPCCGLCNDVRGAIFTPDEMKRLGMVIAEIQKSREARGVPRADRVFTHYSEGRQRGVPSEL